MRKFLSSVMAIGACVAALLVAPLAYAEPATSSPCPGDGLPARHVFDTNWTGLQESSLFGRVASLGEPTIGHSGFAVFFCKSDDDFSSGGDCSPTAGNATDGIITVQGNFVDPLVAGCPDPDLTTSGVLGGTPAVAFVTSLTATEGTADHNGVYIISTVGYIPLFGGYAFDFGGPVDVETQTTLPIGASDIPRPRVLSTFPDPGDASRTIVRLEWDEAGTHSDCTDGVNAFGSCPSYPAPRALSGLEKYAVYKKSGLCLSEPTTSDSFQWGAPVALVDSDDPRTADVSVPNGEVTGDNCDFFAIGLQAAGTLGGAVSRHRVAGQLDSDGDGFPDSTDNCPNDFQNDQADADQDLLGDVCDNCPDPGGANPGQEDSDGDGVGDVCDNCPNDNNPGQEDPDNDLIGSLCDNCPNHNNPGQEDGDADGFGDACDNCRDIHNSNQADGDNDGDGDVCDNCPTVSNSDQADTDEGGGDGVGNACDNCPTKRNNSLSDPQTDSDSDLVGDACDNCQTVFNPGQEDNNDYKDRSKPLGSPGGCIIGTESGCVEGDACEQFISDLTVEFTGTPSQPNRRNSAEVSWTVLHEIDIARTGSFQVVRLVKGRSIPLGPPVDCVGCTDGLEHSYSVKIPKHQNTNAYHVIMTRKTRNGETVLERYGPATDLQNP